jgi:hypothetical protein
LDSKEVGSDIALKIMKIWTHSFVPADVEKWKKIQTPNCSWNWRKAKSWWSWRMDL